VADKLEEATARKLLDSEDLALLSAREVKEFFEIEGAALGVHPKKGVSRDPRNQLPIFFSPGREKRPFVKKDSPHCPICAGNLTRILDLTPLGEGEFCFINKNLYPISLPQGQGNNRRNNWGLHFILWPSNVHDHRFETMPLPKNEKILARIALLEEKLLTGGLIHQGYFTLIRNEGSSVGGSVYHDHFQMLYTNQEPLSFREDRLFWEHQGIGVSQMILEQTPESQRVLSQGSWILLVPPFMKRPYELILVNSNREKRLLHHLGSEDLRDLAFMLQKTFQLQTALFSRYNRDKAYNLTCHNSGYGALYFEVFPQWQPLGGFERLGLYLSQGDPEEIAQEYKSLLFS